jgi:hypothetical protein
MQSIIVVLMAISLFVTLAILAIGLVTMARGGQQSNKYMRLRVIAQFTTVALFVIWALTKTYS